MEYQHYIIADPETDGEEFWKYQRRRHLTASEIFKFLPEDILNRYGWWVESWMGEDRQRETLNLKRTGGQPDFRDPVSVLWGQMEEDHNRQLFEKYAGVHTKGSHGLIKNDRWPYLAATLDGYIKVPRDWTGLANPKMFDRPGQVIDALESVGQATALLEMKQTSDFGVAVWQKGKKTPPKKIIAGAFTPQPPGIPVYNQPQVLTQMAIRSIHASVAVVKGGASHMTAHAMHLPLDWPAVLDIVNDEVAEVMEEIREELDGREHD